jgi:hypothetical protein
MVAFAATRRADWLAWGPSLCSIANVEAGWREAPLCRAYRSAAAGAWLRFCRRVAFRV